MSVSTAKANTTDGDPTKGRWGIVAAALLLQFSIGAVYAWSTIGAALQKAEPFKLTKFEASLPFTVTIGMIFIGTYIGGRWQDKKGPRIVALTGGVIYGLGILLASFANDRADLYTILVPAYGVVSGFGLGLAYIVPIAMLQKWFPDKRGLITGLAVGGFGFGAVLTSPVAQKLIAQTPSQPTKVFLPLGIAYLIMSLIGAAFFRNPPAGYKVPGWEPAGGGAAGTGRDYEQGEALRTPQWYLLTSILTLNVLAGIALISLAAQSARDIGGFSATGAATVVGVLAVFNGAGRIFWATVSDKTGRMMAFAAMLGLQGICFILLPHAKSAALFVILAAVIYLCYGGGFGTMPATAGDFFGVRNAGAIYGLMIVGWSLGGVVGPLLASKLIGTDAYTTGYTVIGVIALAAVGLTVITKKPAAERTGGEVGAAR